MRTARQIAIAVRMGLEELADVYETKEAAFRAVEKISGVSFSMITKFYYREKENPSINTIDRLWEAVEHLRELNTL